MKNRGLPRGVFPKTIPPLSPEEQQISNEFMDVWLESLANNYGIVERFNHGYPLRQLDATQRYKTLDLGAGRGEHIRYENLANQDYYALELRQNLVDRIQADYPDVHTVQGDIQKRLDFPDGFFDRILAIHILEHLPDLPRALDEIKRLLKPNGTFSVLIPCDPGFAYSIARKISAKPLFERRFKLPYEIFIAREHINAPTEIRAELEKRFRVAHRAHFPLMIPVDDLNLIIGYTLTH